MVIGCLNFFFVWLLNKVIWFDVGKLLSFNKFLILFLCVLLNIGVVSGKFLWRFLVKCIIFLLEKVFKFIFCELWFKLYVFWIYLCNFVIDCCCLIIVLIWLLIFFVVKFKWVFKIWLMFICDGMFRGFNMIFIGWLFLLYGIFLIGLIFEIIFLLLWWFVILFFGWIWCFIVRYIFIIFNMLGVKLLFWIILLCFILSLCLNFLCNLLYCFVSCFNWFCFVLFLSVCFNYFLWFMLFNVVLVMLFFIKRLCICVNKFVFKIFNFLVKFFFVLWSCIFLIFNVCLFFCILLCVKIWILIIVFEVLFGMCNEEFFILDVFLLKIVCKSFFFGVNWVLFLGVILFIKMLLFLIFVFI